MIATGHYARVENGRLLRSADENKDQTYFLHRVARAALQKTILPIGGFAKSVVRKKAAEFDLPTATKKDSQGICFVGPVGMKDFLSQYIRTEPGAILTKDGNEIGQHNGAIFFTIGQRHGLGVGGGTPFYVLTKNMDKNTVTVTNDPADLELCNDRVQLDAPHWIDGRPTPSKNYQVRFRHRGELFACTIDTDDALHLGKSAHALAAGQSAVMYDGDVCLGGGVMALTTLRQLSGGR